MPTPPDAASLIDEDGPTPAPRSAQPDAPVRGRRELVLRVASSAVLAPAALAAAWAPQPVFAGVIAGGGVILAREWTRMADPQGDDRDFALAVAGAAGATIAASAGLVVLALTVLVVMAVSAGVSAAGRGRMRAAGLGLLYVSAPCALIVWLRLMGDPLGSQLVTFLFASVWGADIGAYAAGKVFGGPRFAPRISPNKTWAGIVGGVCLAMGLGVVGAWASGLATPSVLVALGAGALGAAGLAGDLLESALKRTFGVKDSGTLIPGHGGLMDRVDGLMTASLALAVWMGGSSMWANAQAGVA